MNKAYIIHGWGGGPDEKWIKWLKNELEKSGFEVMAPAMPDSENPKIDAWVGYLSKIVGSPDADSYFIGHSIGCQAILRYLEILPQSSRIGGAIFIAGWFTLTGIDSLEEKQISSPWLTTPMDFSKIKSHTGKFVAIFSDKDPFVPAENQKMFSEKLGAKIIVEKEKGHFTEADGVNEMPIVLEEILKLR